MNVILEFPFVKQSIKCLNIQRFKMNEKGKKRSSEVRRIFDGKLNFMKYHAFQCTLTHIGNRWNGKWFHITKANASLII